MSILIKKTYFIPYYCIIFETNIYIYIYIYVCVCVEMAISVDVVGCKSDSR